jgi:carotenoid cleavage dioxygenase
LEINMEAVVEALTQSAYLTNRTPIDFEVELGPLPVVGKLPTELSGMLFRNGPNPLFPDPAESLLAGNGMLHGFTFDEGQVFYRNQWIRTQRWAAEKVAGHSLSGNLGARKSGFDDQEGSANTNVIAHAGRILALEEAHLPFAINAQMQALGSVDFDGGISGPFTAHPKMDPQTGEMLFFGYGSPDRFSPDMSFGVVDAAGKLTRFDHFQAPYASMVHDFAVTEHYALFPVMPVTGSRVRAEAGLPPYAWEPALRTHVGIMRRDQGTDSIEWWSSPSCYAFHVMNAWEADGCLIMDMMPFAAPPMFPYADGSEVKGGGSALLTRWTFRLDNPAKTFEQQRLCDIGGEFPRIDDRFAGSRNRHGWFAGHGEGMYSRIVHIDMDANGRAPDIFELPAWDTTSEAVFVPRTQDAVEGDGWVLAVVYRGEEQRSDLVVLDALHLVKGPVAVVALPHRVPNGFHGNWISSAELKNIKGSN